MTCSSQVTGNKEFWDDEIDIDIVEISIVELSKDVLGVNIKCLASGQEWIEKFLTDIDFYLFDGEI